MKFFPLTSAQLKTIIDKYPTPFHIYDESKIRSNLKQLKDAFQWINFKEYFAVKATPNPQIVKL